MNSAKTVVGRVLFVTVACCVVIASVGGGACVVDEIPACPGQCFEFTVERPLLAKCLSGMGDEYGISFTGSDPDGYRGRTCFNSPAIAPVLEAIDHLQAGG